MSWDKNTYNMSEIDRLVDLLKDLKVEYKLTILTKVAGRGNNDDIEVGKAMEYELRKLEYKNTIIIEQMIQTSDCDSDDTIITHKFQKGKIPKKFQLIIEIND